MAVKNLRDYAYMENYDKWIEELATNMARTERWDYLYDQSSFSHPILRNYINHTFKRIQKLSENDPLYWHQGLSNTCFNTGLFTNNFEPIFALFEMNGARSRLKWRFKGFFKESAYELKRISPLPLRANYFSDITELYYDTRYELRVNIDHILEDEENKLRIPVEYRNSPSLAMTFRGMALQYAQTRIKENYKAAVPQYFNGRIQFLIPISLGDPSKVDLALAVNRDGDIYTGRTCLTLDMAYNNARLIAKPETDWLA